MLSENTLLLTSLGGRFLGRLAPGLPSPKIVGLAPCDWIHTFGLRAPLDVAYCDRAGVILALAFNVPPNHLPRRVRGAYTTWEADAGMLVGKAAIGDTLELVDAAPPLPLPPPLPPTESAG